MNSVLAFITNNEVQTTSLLIAETFGKSHKHVLRDVESLVSKGLSEGFFASNFILSEYTDGSGKSNRAYTMTRDGFTLIAMGYSGKEAMGFKEAYIAEFNRQEAQLKTLVELQFRIEAEHKFYALNPHLIEYGE